MKKRIAKKMMKNKDVLRYSDRQIGKAQKLLEKTKPRATENSKQ